MASRDRVTGRGIAARLLSWYQKGHRDLPWRKSADPYCIWVSEIMLQQTRAEVVIPYYQRFLERFPTIKSLADAGEEEALKAWSGLGYYSRIRNMQRAARRMGAEFPRTYDEIRELPGVGEYTAAAIAAIAFGLPHAAVDGNVLRVVARVENDAADIGSVKTRKRFTEVVREWMDARQPGPFTQALMELGATVCLPRNPDCGRCPISDLCRAHAVGTASQLPVKARRVEPLRLSRELAVIRRRGRILLKLEGPDARWMAGFWRLPAPADAPGAQITGEIGTVRHTITHHHYTFTVLAAEYGGEAPIGCRWVAPGQFAEIPLSAIAKKALKCAGIL
jgi:A/G-specific adenine glycosylase